MIHTRWDGGFTKSGEPEAYRLMVEARASRKAFKKKKIVVFLEKLIRLVE